MTGAPLSPRVVACSIVESGRVFHGSVCHMCQERTTIPCSSPQSMTFMYLQRSKHYGVCCEPSLTIETCSCSEILRSIHGPPEKCRQALILSSVYVGP